MLPEELHGYNFSEEDYEYILIASLLHDYDSYQYNYKTSIGLYRFEGPKVENTIRELLKIRIIDAYFSMNEIEFKNYFRQYQYHLLPPVDYVTVHPEYVKPNKPLKSLIIEALIWRTDYPFTKKPQAQRNYYELIDKISHLIGSSEKYILLSEVLSLADLSVTYMSSDPINAWYRVTSLYEELNLPRSEAISKTDQFFSEIMTIELFQELLNNRNFPSVFKQRWDLVYQFYHEGNPSTQINRTIENAQISYSKINLEIGVQTGDILYHIALEHKDEYFIGISTDEEAVLRIKEKFANLMIQNVYCFLGDAKKLLPNLNRRSIDNILFIFNNFPTYENPNGQDPELLLLFKGVSLSLKSHGTFQILTNISKNSDKEKEIIEIASKYGFQLLKSNNEHKIYFPQSYIPNEFFQNDSVSLLVFHLYINSTIVG
jgi:SAM-dependent methyltransferase